MAPPRRGIAAVLFTEAELRALARVCLALHDNPKELSKYLPDCRQRRSFNEGTYCLVGNLLAFCRAKARTKPDRTLENVCADCGLVRVNPGGVHGGACAGCLHPSGKHSWERPPQTKPEGTER
jgi:hypothetical protein